MIRKWMKLILLITISIACLSMASGCGTIFMRQYPSCRSRNFDCYAATRYDAMIIAHGGGIWAYGDCNNGLGPIAGWLVIVPVHIIDLPISIVTDTILLPADFIRDGEKKEKDIQPLDSPNVLKP